jgi:hypothetical protein
MDIENCRHNVESRLAGGQLEAALEALVDWRRKAPLSIEPELFHIRIDLGQDHYRNARDRLVMAVRDCDCPPSLVREVATLLRFLVLHDAMIDWATAYPARAAIKAIEQAFVARTLSAIGAQRLASLWIEEAVGKAPDSIECREIRALIRSFDGDFQGARADLESITEGPQVSAMAWWQLAQLGASSREANLVGPLRQRIAGCDDPRDLVCLNFALFKSLDARGDTDAAWSALAEGCRMARQRAPYNRQGRERLFDTIKQRFPLANAPQAPVAEGPVPIFIVGMHRSGTTLLERILGAHAQVVDYGESQRMSQALRYAADHHCVPLIDPFLIAQADRIDHALVARQFLAEGLRRIGKATHVTEKMPGNFQLIGFIRHALPQARVIHLRRDPMDLCFANLREYFVDGVRYSNSMEDLAHFHGRYLDLMAHWHACYPGFVLDVDYEALVTDPVATSQRIFAFCGLQWNPRVIDMNASADKPTNTLSAVQVRGAISTRSVGRWKPYAKWLEPLRLMLGAPPADGRTTSTGAALLPPG